MPYFILKKPWQIVAHCIAMAVTRTLNQTVLKPYLSSQRAMWKFKSFINYWCSFNMLYRFKKVIIKDVASNIVSWVSTMTKSNAKFDKYWIFFYWFWIIFFKIMTDLFAFRKAQYNQDQIFHSSLSTNSHCDQQT